MAENSLADKLVPTAVVRRPMLAYVILCCALLTALSMLSYSWRQISVLSAPASAGMSNLVGPLGAWTTFVMVMLTGVGAALLPVWLTLTGAGILIGRHRSPKSLVAWSFVLFLCVISLIDLWAGWSDSLHAKFNFADFGGLYGRLFTRALLVRMLSPIGATLAVVLATLGVGVMLVSPRRLRRLWNVTRSALFPAKVDEDEEEPDTPEAAHVAPIYKSPTPKYGSRSAPTATVPDEAAPGESAMPIALPFSPTRAAASTRILTKPPPAPHDSRTAPSQAKPGQPARSAAAPAAVPSQASQAAPAQSTAATPVAAVSAPGQYSLPPFDLLDKPVVKAREEPKVDPIATSQIIVDTLNQFGIETTITNVEVGPVVTRFEIRPAAGVRVERISSLSRNLALALEATSVRVEAPVPGKGVVGIEIPNNSSHTVYLRSILESPTWKHTRAKLPMAIGQDVGGGDLIADLAAMPHILIAGQTGSGKSVCINSILTGLLMSRTPDEMRLLLIDPKIVEFTAYADLPHLVIPIITNPKKVALGLRWAVNEMERRYRIFAKAKVKDISGFNSRVLAEQPELFPNLNGASGAEPHSSTSTSNELPPRLPYIVIVIDELSDLMAIARTDIEGAVTRLAQLSRATGIHMILATQRPSVNVITGTIKTNLPARIAFKVAQRVDSGTILDTSGAETLLGRGDMLMCQPGSDKIVRAQGAMCSDAEIARVTDFVRSQGKPRYEASIRAKIEARDDEDEYAEPPSLVDEPATGDPVDTDYDGDGGDEDNDSKLDDAIEFIRQTKRASTSSLQRRFRMGYTRAARIMDILEKRGILGPPCGSGPREILIDLDGEIPNNNIQSYESKEPNDDNGRNPEEEAN